MYSSSPAGQLEDLFRDVDKQIEELTRRVQTLHPNVQKGLLEYWIPRQVSLITAPIWKVIDKRYARLNELDKQSQEKETREQKQARIKELFEIINPQPIAEELKSITRMEALWTEYNSTMSGFKASFTGGEIINRYHFSYEVATSLSAGCSIALQDAISALIQHAKELKKHFKLLKSKKDSQWVNVAVSFAASLFVGPGGGIAARYLLDEESNEKTDKSMERVFEKLEKFRLAFVNGMKGLEKNLTLVLLNLYGGMLLRLENDIQRIGKSIMDVDWIHRRIILQLNETESKKFHLWAEKTIAQLEVLREKKEWGKLGDAASVALKYSTADPLLAQEIRNSTQTSFAIFFARMRADAINVLANEHWENGRYNQAALLYHHLLSDTNVCWEYLDQETPQEESILLASWRLAIVASNEETKGKELLIFLARRVFSFLIRLNTSKPYSSLPGEYLSRETTILAVIIAHYIHDRDTLIPLTNELLQLLDTLPEWNWLIDQIQELSFTMIAKDVGYLILNEPLKNSITTWFRSNYMSEKQQHFKLFSKRLAYLTGAAAVIIVGIYFAMPYITGIWSTLK